MPNLSLVQLTLVGDALAYACDDLDGRAGEMDNEERPSRENGASDWCNGLVYMDVVLVYE